MSDDGVVTDPVSWFAGEEAITEFEDAFLQTVRAAAPSWGFTDLRPEDTSTDRQDIGRMVDVRVPLLTTSYRVLRSATTSTTSASRRCSLNGHRSPMPSMGRQILMPMTWMASSM